MKTRKEAFDELKAYFINDSELIAEMEKQGTQEIIGEWTMKWEERKKAMNNAMSDWGFAMHESEVDAAEFVLNAFKDVKE